MHLSKTRKDRKRVQHVNKPVKGGGWWGRAKRVCGEKQLVGNLKKREGKTKEPTTGWLISQHERLLSSVSNIDLHVLRIGLKSDTTELNKGSV